MKSETIADEAPPGAPGSSPDRSLLRGGVAVRWVTVTVLTAIYVLSSIDRAALALVIGPMKAEWGITDVQASLLLGLSFSGSYVISTLVAGYFADRVNRKTLIVGAVVMWSTMELACGFSHGYLQLLVARMGLGAAEGVLPSTAYSIIRDSYGTESRARAFSIFHMGPYLGIGLALIGGGTVLHLVESGSLGFSHFAQILQLRPWHIVLIVPGVLGFPVLSLLFLLREPGRQVDPGLSATSATVREAFAHFREHARHYVPLWSAMTLYSAAAAAMTSWLPEAISRTYGVPRPHIGFVLGLIACIASPAGLIVLGSVADRVSRREGANGPVTVVMVSTLVSSVLALSLLFVPEIRVSVAIYCAVAFFFAGFAAAGGATMAAVTPSRLMGKLTAPFFVLQMILGLSSGPTIAAVLASNFHSGPNAIGYGAIETFVVCSFLGAAMLIWLRSGFKESLVAPRSTPGEVHKSPER